MDLIVTNLQAEAEAEEDDYGSYFLQPASSPYNIAEKIQQANIDLFDKPVTMERTSRVKFKEELATFEPDLTDDDVVSIESDVEEVNSILSSPANEGQVLEYRSPRSVLTLNIFDINEDGEEVSKGEEEVEDEEVVEEEEEVLEVEDVENEYSADAEELCKEISVGSDFGSGDVSVIQQDTVEEVSGRSHREVKLSSNIVNKSAGPTNHAHGPRRPKRPLQVIDCKSHCIERLDFDLSMSIRKLDIQEKPANCPLLKLQKRKCCDENKFRNSLNLPCYNGLRSEYGLSSADLQKRERQKEVIKLKQQKRQQLLDEYKNRKNQQNEQVFCQWLRDVSRRKSGHQRQKGDRCKEGADGANAKKQSCNPSIISFPTGKMNSERIRERPKTANDFVPRHNIKRARRPHTSPACVFIQVPPKLLERGINIGDLLVTKNNFAAKKMHILALSS